MRIWVCFQWCKRILDDIILILNMEDENDYLDEYLLNTKI